MCKSFASLCCVYLGATTIPNVQDAILNLPTPYVRSTTVLLDTKKNIKVITRMPTKYPYFDYVHVQKECKHGKKFLKKQV